LENKIFGKIQDGIISESQKKMKKKFFMAIGQAFFINFLFHILPVYIL
jgi:hypothetical protein